LLEKDLANSIRSFDWTFARCIGTSTYYLSRS